MVHLFALWPVSPHSSHIAVSIRGQSARLWPFGSSVPLQLVHLCSGVRTREAQSAFVGRAAACAASCLRTFITNWDFTGTNKSSGNMGNRRLDSRRARSLFPQGSFFIPAGLSLYSRRTGALFPQGRHRGPGHSGPARRAPTAMAGIRVARHAGPGRAATIVRLLRSAVARRPPRRAS